MFSSYFARITVGSQLFEPALFRDFRSFVSTLFL